MANDSKNPVVETVIWAATVGGFAGLIGLFVPVSRSFFETNGLLGWILFASLLTLLPWIVRSLVKAGTRGKEGPQERWDARASPFSGSEAQRATLQARSGVWDVELGAGLKQGLETFTESSIST